MFSFRKMIFMKRVSRLRLLFIGVCVSLLLQSFLLLFCATVNDGTTYIYQGSERPAVLTTTESSSKIPARHYWTVLVTVNHGVYDFFLNWLVYYKRLHLHGMTVIVVAEDDVVFTRLKDELGLPKSFKLERSNLAFKTTKKKNSTAASDAETAAFYNATGNYFPLMEPTRAGLILQKLEQGLNVLYSDADTVWLSNPIPYINTGDPADVTMQTDDEPGDEAHPHCCSGLMAIRANQRTIQLMKNWQKALKSSQLNQPVFNRLLTSERGLTHQQLPHVEFPHGSTFFSENNNVAARGKAVVVHNNHIVGNDEKKKQFEKFNLWKVGVGRWIDGVGTLATLFVNTHAAKPGTQKYYIQRNTLLSLTMLRPEVDVVVFSTDPSVKKVCKSLRIRVIKDVESNPHGTPFLRSMYQKIEEDFSIMSHFIGYMNADVIFDSKLTTTLKSVLKACEEGQIRNRVLLVGLRTNVEMPPNFSHNQSDILQDYNDLDNYVARLKKRGHLFTTPHEDFFIVTPGTLDWSEIPEFVIGRPAYDNWLVDYVYHKSDAGTHSLIDATNTVTAIHQTGMDGNTAGWAQKPDKCWNRERSNESQWDHGSVYNAEWETRVDKESNVIALYKRDNYQSLTPKAGPCVA